MPADRATSLRRRLRRRLSDSVGVAATFIDVKTMALATGVVRISAESRPRSFAPIGGADLRLSLNVAPDADVGTVFDAWAAAFKAAHGAVDAGRQ